MENLLKAIILATVLLLGITGTAQADPGLIGFAVLSALLPATTAITTFAAYAVGYAVLAAVSIGASFLAGAFNKPSIQPQEYKNIFETGNSSELRAIGRVRIGGLKAFGNTTGFDRYRLICHTKGLWSATESHFLGGREVTVEADGAVSSPPFAKPAAFPSPSGSYVYITEKLGDGTETAWAALVSAFSSLWTSDHRVRGIHQTLIKYISPGLSSSKFLKLYQSGEPAYEKVGRAEPVYDPRDSGQDANDSSTWVWSDNAILCAVHVLRAYPSISSTDIDYADIAIEATKADAIVSTLVGTEARARAWGVWPSENPRGEVLDQLLRSIGAEIVPGSNNTYTIRLVEDNPVSEITFLEKHVLSIDMATGPESVQRPNTTRVKYYSPERNYDFADINLSTTDWYNIQSEIDNVGEQIEETELPFCPSSSQAQRIARRLFLTKRADAGIIKLTFAGLAAWGRTIATLPFPGVGNNNETEWKKCAIGTPRVDDENGTVEIPFLVWPQDLIDFAWDAATMEAPAPEAIPDLQYESELDTPAAPTNAISVELPDTSKEVRVTISPVPTATQAEVTVRTYTGSLPNVWQSMTEIGLTSAYIAENWFGDRLDFRVRFFNSSGDSSYFSDLLEVAALAGDNTPLDAPTLSVTGTNGNWDAEVTIADNWNVASAKVQYRTYNTSGGPTGSWIDEDERSARPLDNYTVEVNQSAPGLNTIAIRAVAYTTDGTATSSTEFTHDEPL